MSQSISRHVCMHELQIKLRSKTLSLLFIVGQILLLIALWTSWQQYKAHDAQQTLAQKTVEQQWIAQPDRHPHRVAHFGHFAFRPPSALSFFDIGINNWVGNSIFLEAHKQNTANFANDGGGASLLRFSELSIANILLLIWPLLLVAIAYASISQEKERGTLKQQLAMGVSLFPWLWGKFLAYSLISLAFILPVFIASFTLISANDLALTGDILTRITLLFISYLIYCAFWIALILFVSLKANSSKNSLNVLISLWFVMTILSPRILSETANMLYPHKGFNDLALAVKLDVRKVGNSHNPDDPYFNEFKSRLLAQYQVERIEDLPVNYKGMVMQEGEKLTAEIYQKHYQAQLDKFQKQQQFISWFYPLNPYLAVRDLSMALSGSDQRHFFDFEQSAEQHRFERTQKLNEIHAHHIHYHDDRAQRASASHWAEFPQFAYQTPELAWSLAPLKTAILWPIALIIFLMMSFKSKRVQRRAHVRT